MTQKNQWLALAHHTVKAQVQSQVQILTQDASRILISTPILKIERKQSLHQVNKTIL